MNIKTTNDNGKITIVLDGWLDTASSPLLGEETSKITEASQIILDFNKVEYVASSGIREVVACHRKAKEINADLEIINVSGEIYNIFKLTGLDKKLVIKMK